MLLYLENLSDANSNQKQQTTHHNGVHQHEHHTNTHSLLKIKCDAETYDQHQYHNGRRASTEKETSGHARKKKGSLSFIPRLVTSPSQRPKHFDHLENNNKVSGLLKTSPSQADSCIDKLVGRRNSGNSDSSGVSSNAKSVSRNSSFSSNDSYNITPPSCKTANISVHNSHKPVRGCCTFTPIDKTIRSDECDYNPTRGYRSETAPSVQFSQYKFAERKDIPTTTSTTTTTKKGSGLTRSFSQKYKPPSKPVTLSRSFSQRFKSSQKPFFNNSNNNNNNPVSAMKSSISGIKNQTKSPPGSSSLRRSASMKVKSESKPVGLFRSVSQKLKQASKPTIIRRNSKNNQSTANNNNDSNYAMRRVSKDNIDLHRRGSSTSDHSPIHRNNRDVNDSNCSLRRSASKKLPQKPTVMHVQNSQLYNKSNPMKESIGAPRKSCTTGCPNAIGVNSPPPLQPILGPPAPHPIPQQQQNYCKFTDPNKLRQYYSYDSLEASFQQGGRGSQVYNAVSSEESDFMDGMSESSSYYSLDECCRTPRMLKNAESEKRNCAEDEDDERVEKTPPFICVLNREQHKQPETDYYDDTKNCYSSYPISDCNFQPQVHNDHQIEQEEPQQGLISPRSYLGEDLASPKTYSISENELVSPKTYSISETDQVSPKSYVVSENDEQCEVHSPTISTKSHGEGPEEEVDSDSNLTEKPRGDAALPYVDLYSGPSCQNYIGSLSITSDYRLPEIKAIKIYHQPQNRSGIEVDINNNNSKKLLDGVFSKSLEGLTDSTIIRGNPLEGLLGGNGLVISGNDSEKENDVSPNNNEKGVKNDDIDERNTSSNDIKRINDGNKNDIRDYRNSNNIDEKYNGTSNATDLTNTNSTNSDNVLEKELDKLANYNEQISKELEEAYEALKIEREQRILSDKLLKTLKVALDESEKEVKKIPLMISYSEKRINLLEEVLAEYKLELYKNSCNCNGEHCCQSKKKGVNLTIEKLENELKKEGRNSSSSSSSLNCNVKKNSHSENVSNFTSNVISNVSVQNTNVNFSLNVTSKVSSSNVNYSNGSRSSNRSRDEDEFFDSFDIEPS